MKSSRQTPLFAAVVALMVAACTPHTDDKPETGTPPAGTTAPAPAPIKGFPDMSAYTQVERRAYLVAVPHSPGLHFSTSDGMTCWLGANPTPEQAYASCTGARPDKGPGDWEVSAERGKAGLAEKTPAPMNPGYVEPTPLTLPPLHVLRDDDDQYCGIDEKGTTACRVGEHGFILTPTSTTLF